MKIRRLLLHSFGCLKGEFHFSAERANLVVEPNERGKSTLSAALLAGLYGFPPGQRRSETRPITDLEIYRPWKGEEYLVEMDVEVSGELFTVRRDFGSRKEQVFDGRSGKEITERFQKAKDHVDFGGSHTGLKRGDFSRTIFLRQSEMQQIRDARGITAALQKMATSQQGDVAASEATGVLTESLRQFRGRKIRRGKVESEIAGIDEEIDSLQEKLDDMEGRRAEVEEQLRELEKTSRKAEEIEAEIERLEYLIIAAGQSEAMKQMDDESHDREELEDREKEFQKLSEFEKFPSGKRSRLSELKVHRQALAESEEKLRVRLHDEVEEPLTAARALLEETRGLENLDAAESSGIGGMETNLAAAWKVERESRRSLRSTLRKLETAGTDPGRVRDLSSRYGNLSEDERRFLLDYAVADSEARRALSDAERESDGLEDELSDTEEKVGQTRTLRTGLAFGGGIALVAALVLWFVAPAAVALGTGALGLVLLALRFTMFSRSQSEEDLESIRSSRKFRQRSRSDQEEALASLGTELAAIARKVEAPGDPEDGPEAVLEEFREAERLAEKAGGLAALDRALADAGESFRRAAEPLRALMEKARHEPRFGALTPGTARRFREMAESCASLREEIEQIEEKRTSLQGDLSTLADEQEEVRKETAAILEEAGLDTTLEAADAEEEFDTGSRSKERYELLKKEIIPNLVRRSLGKENEALARQIETTGIILRRKAEEIPGLADLQAEKTHKEYSEDRLNLTRQSRDVAERRLELAHQLGEVLREYRRDTPDTQRWLREWQSQKRRAVAFKESVELAREVLDSLSREAYAEWADVLNERASEALAYISPGYEDLKFDEDLSFTIRESSGRERRTQHDVDLRFSAGARDQVYLSARLAMAGYLSAGPVKLPLILDDPFASFDDERFARAMNVMLEKFSKRHQLIILSCHEARHRAWQDRHPEIFADRVRIMSLQPVTT